MTAPRILVVEHEAKCPPAHVGDWLVEAGCAVDVLRPHAGDTVPLDLEHDALVVLGGSMGANDDDVAPWLPNVRELVRGCAQRRRPTLGICLGHQLVAVALGGRVGRNPRGQQLGLIPTGWSDHATTDPVFGTRPRVGIHWNNDIVTELPAGAVVLAQTPAGEPQAVRFTDSVWGVQLHPEADEYVVAAWAAGDRDVHAARGIDQATLLDAIATARSELDAAWRPVVRAFVEEARR